MALRLCASASLRLLAMFCDGLRVVAVDPESDQSDDNACQSRSVAARVTFGGSA